MDRSSVRADANLATRLRTEDHLEHAGRLPGDRRLTCPVHRRWIHHCVSSPVHVNQVTGHRWCRRCAEPLNVAVDELARTVAMSCPECGDGRSAATARLVTACKASLAAESGELRIYRVA